ncbi:Gmad2 immunoglobulin-like domain-containing protein [Aeromicrobium sp.]|uniref:Gmad2 immunoglobulin-like domain-containing protein n=1 Tax=Aeromicrobium sp. TaxID=1871063 RepID=UPI002FC9CE45
MAKKSGGAKGRVWLAVVAMLLVSAAACDEGGDDSPRPTEPTATSEPAPTTTAPGAITQQEAATVVWPDPAGELRYNDPMTAVAGYAEELIGFDAPAYGEFMPGDSRSGEVELRATARGAVTTVLVRQMGDGNWYVLGSSTPNIELETPAAGASIDDPLSLAGRARAFEGTVQVSVFELGGARPVGEGFVTGRGDGVLGAFSDEVRWDNPGTGRGVLVLYTESAEDGSVWEAMSIPVTFAG